MARHRVVMSENRRTFLKSAAALTALSQSRILGANERIRIGSMGTGGRCQGLLGNVNKVGGAEIVAICDVYENRRAEARAKLAPAASEHLDYREVLDRKDIDAVFIGSPDHWHVPMTIDAVRAGKDVYVEKPVSHSIEEGARLIAAVEASKQIVQVGYQQRSWDIFALGAEIVHSGRLGQVALVLSSWYQDYLRNFGKLSPVDPAKVEWKRFLGSAPDQPFEARRFLQWRWYWHFGGGHLTDLHSHWCDVIHWYMQSSRPESAQTMGSVYAMKGWDCPDTINAAWAYPGFTVVYNGTLVGHLEGGAIVFRGSRAEMRITRDGLAVYPEGVLAAEKTNFPDPVITARSTGDGTIDHVRNFLDCVRSRKAPNAPVQSSVTAANAAHMGNHALRKGRAVSAAELGM
ncbi:MAG: Gfo/Idh/MocA family oxidoreductase [Acidobacteria bacterium]|nr:Gfo/Idh/MocA family oxidoreductase [Acidobacteriota bacterium]